MDFLEIGLGKLITPEISTIITIVAIFFLIRRQEEKIDGLTKALKERDAKLEERDAKFDNKITEIENQMKDFITKEEHYRDVSGWRGELQKLDAKLDRFIEKFIEIRRD
jgi:Skp family chaperone for outer membrane proteins